MVRVSCRLQFMPYCLSNLQPDWLQLHEAPPVGGSPTIELPPSATSSRVVLATPSRWHARAVRALVCYPVGLYAKPGK